MISINKQPQIFTPVDSPVQFQISSDIPNVIYFGVQVQDALTNEVIANQKYQTLPNYTSGTAFDLSSVLDSYVSYQIVTSSNLIEATPKLLQAYNLVITENLVSGSTIVAGTIFTGGTYNVWNAELDRVKFNGFNSLNYALSASGTTRFLTDKPLISNIYQSSDEYLYFLNAGINANVKYDFYGAGNILLGTHTISGITATTKAYRINVSPTVIDAYFGYTLGNLYGGEFEDMFADPFGTNVSINDTNYFTVQLVDNSGNTRSEIRTYILRSDKCNAEPIQMLFSNDLGGFDSVTMFNPLESIAVTKSSITTYPYQINTAGDYTNINDGVFNEANVVYNVVRQSTYKVFSDILNDSTAQWLKCLISAKIVYVKLGDDTLLPVTITTTSFSIPKRKYNTNNNRLEIEFKVKESGLKF